MSQSTNRWRMRWALLILASFLGGFVVAHLLAGDEAVVPAGDRGQKAQTTGSQTGPTRITENTEIEYQVFYDKCGHLETDIAPIPTRVMVGLNLEDFGRLFPDWQVESFTPRRVVLKRRVQSMCPDDGANRLITVKDRMVVVFYGSGKKPGSPLMLETAVEAKKLRAQDRQRLEAGVVVSSDQEVFDWLEGIAE
ncbi:MAG: hypothetical protein Q8P50_07280 [Bacillota bacterium]|nr:hypothetical protein [Bacillota bacterium]